MPLRYFGSKPLKKDRLLNILVTAPNRFQNDKKCSIAIGWGYKPSAKRALDKKNQTPNCQFLRAEEGFYSYLSSRHKTPWRLSYILDKTGMYYNADAPSDLEHILNNNECFTPEMLERAQRAMATVKEYGLTKYPSIAAPSVQLSEFTGRFKRVILLVDQTFGDLSVTMGQASEADFANMLRLAHEQAKLDPDTGVVIKVHPDVLAGSKKGYLGHSAHTNNVLLCSEHTNPYALFALVNEVWTVTSQMGFEALIAGKKVRCFGLPFYAGWGLTHDEKHCARRTQKRILTELFAAAVIEYPNYIDPFTEQECELEQVLAFLVNKQTIATRYQGINEVICIGFSLWKRCFLRVFLAPLFKQITFVGKNNKALNYYEQLINNKNSGCGSPALVAWGHNALTLKQQHPDKSILCLEDGFIRSIGLGTNLKKPSSLALDFSGLHFAPRLGSDLYEYFSKHTFTKEQKARATALIADLLALKISKYNLNEASVDLQIQAHSKTIILIPGQVPGDASITHGAYGVKNNLELIAQVRADNPDAFIVYKPHPDVVSGNRADTDLNTEQLAYYTDLVVSHGNILDYITQADEIHTITSQSGFEALLRGKKVVCYGLPFYAGWGLTDDRVHRTAGKSLTLEELVYGALIWYPLYFDWQSKEYCLPESIVAKIAKENIASADCSATKGIKWPRRLLTKVKYLFELIEFRVKH